MLVTAADVRDGVRILEALPAPSSAELAGLRGVAQAQSTRHLPLVSRFCAPGHDGGPPAALAFRAVLNLVRFTPVAGKADWVPLIPHLHRLARGWSEFGGGGETDFLFPREAELLGASPRRGPAARPLSQSEARQALRAALRTDPRMLMVSRLRPSRAGGRPVWTRCPRECWALLTVWNRELWQPAGVPRHPRWRLAQLWLAAQPGV